MQQNSLPLAKEAFLQPTTNDSLKQQSDLPVMACCLTRPIPLFGPTISDTTTSGRTCKPLLRLLSWSDFPSSYDSNNAPSAGTKSILRTFPASSSIQNCLIRKAIAGSPSRFSTDAIGLKKR